MKIVRAESSDTDLFSENELAFGACCFFTEDKSCRYFFEINKREATLYTNTVKYVEQAIDEFLFYSGFVTSIKDSASNVLYTNATVDPYLHEIRKVQPSQFYISEEKLKHVKNWIKSPNDILIPVMIKDEQVISLDGHTRMKAAIDFGYTSVYIYPDDADASIFHFVNEAIKRRITSVYDMKVLSEEEYKIKWDKFCDDFFDSAEP